MKPPHYRKSIIPKHAKKVFEGVIFDVYQWEQELFDGSTAIYEKLMRPDTMIIFPILEDGRILLIEDSQPGEKTDLTAPAGKVDEGETPEETAQRELREETGYEPETVELWYSLQPHSKIDWFQYIFIGRNCRKVCEPECEPGERIELKPITFDELIAHVESGTYAPASEFNARILREKLSDPTLSTTRKLFEA